MSTIPVRKDIRALGTAERERFFFCLKFLAVLPPRQSNSLRNFYVTWKILNGQRYYSSISPKNIHDEFIASHQTCCEHGTVYFTYYHRHLMICVQIALNYAEQVLLGGRGQLPDDLYKSHQKQFDNVFSYYKGIIGRFKSQKGLNSNENLPQISLHYWNPVDYTQTILYPAQLRRRTPDVMDTLYYAHNSHYPWNFNFSTRWFSTSNNQKQIIPSQFQTMGFFQSQPAEYSPTQKQIIYGNLNPRSTTPDQFFGVDRIDIYGMTQLANSASQINLYKNHLQLAKTSNTIDVCTLDQDQIDTLFGSKTKNLHWLSMAQRAQMNKDNAARAYTYNKALPHFQFAYSLFKSNKSFMENYLTTQDQAPENSVQNCHNTMHDYLQIFMSDSQLSITNLIFFLYHSWIDYALQVKIRMIRTSQKNQQQFLKTKDYLDNKTKAASIMDRASGKGKIKFGNYYIFEWATPNARFYPQINVPTFTSKDYQAAFKSRNFILNEQVSGIRRSDELGVFYNSQYAPNNQSKYSSFRNFGNFIFDYNYEIYDYDGNGKVLLVEMKENRVPIPSYIQAISNDYNDIWNNNFARNGTSGNKTSAPLFLASNIEDASQISPLKLHASNFQSLSPDNPNQSRRKSRQIKYLKAVKLAFGGYARYPSTIRSTVAPILLKITEKGKQQLKLMQESLKILDGGIVISVASLLTRGAGSEICPNCKDYKQYIIQCSNNIAQIDKKLYCDIAKSITVQEIFKIVNNKEVPVLMPNISEVYVLQSPRKVFSKLEIIQGAVQVQFEIFFQGIEDPQQSSIQIALYSYNIEANELFTIISRKKQQLSREDGSSFVVQFPKVNGQIENISNKFKYVYREAKVSIKNGSEYQYFSFKIPYLHPFISFGLYIDQKFDEQNKGYLDVRVVDKDYKFKIDHYESNSIQ